eukprot:730956-Karenia_brevis.AAC.1
MEASDEATVKAMSSTGTARMVQKEFNSIRMAHLTGAATEFQIQKVWECPNTWVLNTKQLMLRHWKHPISYKQLCKGWGRRSMPWGSCHRAWNKPNNMPVHISIC